MNLSEHQDTFRIIGITAAAFLILGLGGWYIFLSRSEANLESIGESRGFSVGIPSFSGSRGSTIENLVQGLAPRGAEPIGTSTNIRPPRLFQVSQTPVAGAAFIVNGSTTLIRFVERSNGHVFDANLETGEVIRRTNTSLGTIYEAHVGSGEAFLLRTLDDEGDVRTLFATFGTTTENDLRDLETRDVGPTHGVAFRGETPLFLFGNGGSRLVASSTNKEELLFSSSLQGWHIVRTSPLVVAERPAHGILGSAFRVFSPSRIERIATERGLTIAAHPQSEAYLIGTAGESMALFAQTSATTTRALLDIKTIADKCAWAPGRSLTAYCAVPQDETPGGFLDLWYRGAVHTNDHWFTVESGSGTTERLFAPEGDLILDVENPHIDESARYILFMNARDKSLWTLRIYE